MEKVTLTAPSPEAIKYVKERLEAWHDYARIAYKQLEGFGNASHYRHEMMNYAHLIDVLNGSKLPKNK